jgi:hypothetical protein
MRIANESGAQEAIAFRFRRAVRLQRFCSEREVAALKPL